MKSKISTLCKIKNKLAEIGLISRSPSASLRCEYGFYYQTSKCDNCPRKISLGRYFE